MNIYEGSQQRDFLIIFLTVGIHHHLFAKHKRCTCDVVFWFTESEYAPLVPQWHLNPNLWGELCPTGCSWTSPTWHTCIRRQKLNFLDRSQGDPWLTSFGNQWMFLANQLFSGPLFLQVLVLQRATLLFHGPTGFGEPHQFVRHHGAFGWPRSLWLDGLWRGRSVKKPT